MPRIRRIHPLALLAFCLCLTLAYAADTGKKVLTFEDYPRWSRIVSSGISADGRWVSYGYRPNDGDETLHFKNLAGDQVHKIEGGTGPAFSDDAAWAACVVNLPKAEAEKLQKARRPVPKKVELLNLGSGEKQTVENASSFKFSADSRFLAVRTDKSNREAKHDGTDLILRNLQTGLVQNIGNVSLFEFNKPGSQLAYTVDAADRTGNGVYLMDLASGSLQALDTARADYAQLAWNKEGSAVAVLRGDKKKGFEQKENTLLAFAGLNGGERARIEYDPSADDRFPKEMVLSESGDLTWSADNSRIFFGIKEQEKAPEKNDTAVPNVDVWHWKDERVQSVQMVRANLDRRATYSSVLHLNGKRFVRLADEPMPSVTLTEDHRWGIGRLDKPYRMEINWGGSRADYYLVSTDTGERKPIVAGIGRSYGASPDSRWFLYQKDKELWVYDIRSGATRNISRKAGVNFVDEGDDHPYEKPIHGVAGWSKDGRSVLVNHKFDIWSLPLGEGKAENITKGAGDKEQIVFRYVNLEPEEGGGPGEFFRRGGRGGRSDTAIDTAQPLTLSAYGEWNKRSGYYRLKTGAAPQPLIFEDRSIGRVTRAKNADTLLYTMQTFVDFPDYYVSGLDFASPRKVTDANPQQAEYAWGRRILIDYKNGNGVPLQATLALPANYEPGKRYPMLVYFYEKMSQQHHNYSMPNYDDRPHMSLYASDGYLVLQPDVVYTIGRPGDSAVDCVTSAVKKVIEMGYADPKRIGVQGHSWGGYQTSFLVTQTDLFACVVTGAPVTNLVSFTNELYKSSGNVQQGITERGQVRMGVSYWENPALYHSQSPVHQAEKIKTPFLILHGTEDGAVDWHQGLEYYNTARRLGKEVILLSYPGEGHHLAKLENQKDFLQRMKQYFDHYCKGMPAPDWMTAGVPFLKKPKPSTEGGEGERPGPPRRP